MFHCFLYIRIEGPTTHLSLISSKLYTFVFCFFSSQWALGEKMLFLRALKRADGGRTLLLPPPLPLRVVGLPALAALDAEDPGGFFAAGVPLGFLSPPMVPSGDSPRKRGRGEKSVPTILD